MTAAAAGPPWPPRAFVFLHALKNGTTTIIDVGGLRGDWDGYARLVDDLGVRVYGARRSATATPTRTRRAASTTTRTRRRARRLKEAVDFVKSFDGAAQGRLRGMLNAAQVETCSEPLLRAGKDAARELDVPIHTHAGGNLVEFQRIMDEYRKTPIRFLADIGFLDDRTLHRPRGLHHRARLVGLSVRRRPARARRARRDRRATARTSTRRWR